MNDLRARLAATVTTAHDRVAALVAGHGPIELASVTVTARLVDAWTEQAIRGWRTCPHIDGRSATW